MDPPADGIIPNELHTDYQHRPEVRKKVTHTDVPREGGMNSLKSLPSTHSKSDSLRKLQNLSKS